MAVERIGGCCSGICPASDGTVPLWCSMVFEPFRGSPYGILVCQVVHFVARRSTFPRKVRVVTKTCAIRWEL
jgi:hypothetical protein